MSTQIRPRPIEILLVDDNPGDVLLTETALKDLPSTTTLNVVGDGDETMAFLRRDGAHGDAPRPDLVLFDLNETVARC
jgi:CheY-like chemotaxis protein